MKLKTEFDYYLQNKAKLIAQYSGKFIVIKGAEVLGSYSTSKEALEETLKKYELGSFLIQHAIEGEEKAIYRSRVA